MSSDSESYQPRVPMCNHSPSEVNMCIPGRPDECTALGGHPFLRANTLLYEGESVTHRFDCNTVGPVPVVSGYGFRTLTHSAVHVLDSSKDNASALSSGHEKILRMVITTFESYQRLKSGTPISRLLPVATSILKKKECYRDRTQL